MSTQTASSTTRPPIDFREREKILVNELKSNRVDLQISSLRKIEIEFLEYEDNAAENSFFYSFTKYEKKAPKSKFPHRIATKKELQLFLKNNSNFIINLVLSCPHEELLRHSIPIISRLFQNDFLPKDFCKRLYQTAERLSGPIALRAQDVIMELFSKLPSNEKIYFVDSIMKGSEKGQIESLHFLCKLINSQVISLEKATNSFNLISKNIHLLEEDVIPMTQVPSLSVSLRKNLIKEFMGRPSDSSIVSALKIIFKTAPFGNDISDIKQLIDMSILNEIPYLKEILIEFGNNEPSLFPSCVLGVIKLVGFNEINKWLVPNIIGSHVEDMMNILLTQQLPGCACILVRNTFIQYNTIITNGLVLDSNSNLISIDYQKLFGIELLWEMAMKSEDWGIQNIIMKIYQSRLQDFISDGLIAFVKNPSEAGARMIQVCLQMMKEKKERNELNGKKEGKIKLRRVVKEKDGIKQAELKVKKMAIIYDSSENVKMYKMFSEEVNSEVKRTKKKLGVVCEIEEKEYHVETPINVIVIDIFSTICDRENETMGKIKRIIEKGNYSTEILIDGEKVDSKEIIGNIVKSEGKMEIFIQEGGINNEEAMKENRKEMKENVVVKNGRINKEEFHFKEKEIEKVIEIIEKDEYYYIGLILLKEINEFIEWQEKEINLIRKEKERVGIARLHVMEKIENEVYKELIDIFCDRIKEKSENTKLIAEVLLKNEKDMSKETFLISEERTAELDQRIGEESIDKKSLTFCFILLLRNSKKIEWDKEVIAEPIKRILEETMNDELFETVIPHLEEPTELVEECYEIIIQFIDKRYSNEDDFIKKMIENIKNGGKGFKFSVRALKIMKEKQILIQPYLIELMDKVFQKQGTSLMKEDNKKEFVEMICECFKNVEQEQKEQICAYYNDLLATMEDCGGLVEMRKEKWGGLINQGCTCYMNSILQQLFHSQHFRSSLFQKKIGMPSYKEMNIELTQKQMEDVMKKVKFSDFNGITNKHPKEGLEKENNSDQKGEKEIPIENIKEEFVVTKKNDYLDYQMIKALQDLFIEMQESVLQVTDTKEFCKMAHGSCYEQVNVHEQMDAQEFFNTTISSMETCKTEPNVIEAMKLFKGEMEISIKSHCGHVVKRNEPFCCSALEVEHCQTMEQSLQSLCDGSILCDYRCEECGKTSDAQRSEKYIGLPNVLVFHLKRFGYNDQFEIVKYNGKFEYPNEIDLKKYCCEDINGGTQYKLAGIVIHSGGAHGGHYISNRLINGKWVCFNDRTIGDAENETWFGGKTTNAYMLFYERVGGEENEETREISVDNELLERIEAKNTHYLLSQRASDPVLIDLIKGVNKHFKYIGNTLSFVRTVIIKRNPEKSKEIFEGIAEVMDLEIAKEVLKKVSNIFLKEYLKWGESMIIAAIKQQEEPIFVESVVREVQNGNEHGIKIIEELYHLKQIKLSTAVRLSIGIIKNQRYNRNEGKIACLFILEAIKQDIYPFDDDVIMKFNCGETPEDLVNEIINKYPTQKINDCAMKVLKGALSKKEIYDDELIQLKRFVLNINCASNLVKECLRYLKMAPEINRYIKIISITLKVALVSPLIHHELKKKVKDFNEIIDFYSFKIII